MTTTKNTTAKKDEDITETFREMPVWAKKALKITAALAFGAGAGYAVKKSYNRAVNNGVQKALAAPQQEAE